MSKPSLIYPPLLKKGDTIAIVAPASPPEKPKVIATAMARLKKYGFKIKPGKFLQERDGYLAGSDKERAADINAAFADPGVQGVFCLRGGYGSCRILPLLDYAAIRANPKPFLGYSDITAMHLAILVKSGLVTFHGSNASSAFEPPNLKWCEKMLMGAGESDVLFQRDRVHKLVKTVVPGRARGKLIGGNFTCLLRLIGTPWQPDFRGAILFLEDTGEKAYRIDGMFTHLRLAGLLEQIGGLILGQFDYDADRREQARIAEVLPREAKQLGVPCITGAPIGHFPSQIIVPQGVDAELDAGAGPAVVSRSLAGFTCKTHGLVDCPDLATNWT